VQIDRQKAKSLHVPFTQITDALQVYRGSVYVERFSTLITGRIACMCSPKDGNRSSPKDIGQYYLRLDTGKLIPLDNFTKN